MSLPLELARRLWEVREASAFGHGNPWESAGPGERASFEHMADECIRQAEWSRRSNLPFVTTWKMELTYPPLTLAPEDWKP